LLAVLYFSQFYLKSNLIARKNLVFFEKLNFGKAKNQKSIAQNGNAILIINPNPKL